MRWKTALALVALLATPAIHARSPEDGSPRELTPEDISPAFNIPKSDLVFEGVLILGSGQPTAFEAREGSMIMINRTPDDPSGRVGVTLTLDRARFRESRELGVVVGTAVFRPHEAGGEYHDFLGEVTGRYNEEIRIEPQVIPLTIKIKRHHFEDFKDGLLITMLWEAVKQDPNALRGLYDELNTIYGPLAQECYVCPDGAIRCATSVNCGFGWN